MTESRGYVVNVRMGSELLSLRLDLVMSPGQRRMFPGALPTPAVSGHRAGQELVHEGDVGDGQSQRLYPRQSLLVSKSRDLQSSTAIVLQYKIKAPKGICFLPSRNIHLLLIKRQRDIWV